MTLGQGQNGVGGLKQIFAGLGAIVNQESPISIQENYFCFEE